MSEIITIQFNSTQTNIERLRCTICTGYLSCAPIRLLPDGSNICGQCSPLNNDTAYRQVTLETILDAATFPCRFIQQGCNEQLLFGNTLNHEASCAHRPLNCFVCSWQGSAMQISKHLHEHHPHCFKQEAQFIINVVENDQNCFIVDKNGVPFVIKYVYTGNSNDLQYIASYISSNVRESYCKIELINVLEPDYIVQCKGGKCVNFDHGRNDMRNSTILNISNHLRSLNDPKKITVVFNFDWFASVQHLVVNYDIIESNKCKKCQYYLIPPLYDTRDGIICFSCSCSNDSCTPTIDKNLNNLLGKQNYPCRWRGCDLIKNAHNISMHELECEFRTYRCIIQDCKNMCTRTSLVEHCKQHNYSHFVDQVSYKVNFKNSPDINHLFTVINNEIVIIEYSIKSYHYLLLQHCKHPDQFSATIYVEHTHCKCKSKLFSLGKQQQLRIYPTDLPDCFKIDDELTVTLKIG